MKDNASHQYPEWYFLSVHQFPSVFAVVQVVPIDTFSEKIAKRNQIRKLKNN
jgi:hypothetical protein